MERNTIDLWVLAEQVLPPHEVRNREKLEAIVASMRRDGWIGRPLLAELAYGIDPNPEDRPIYIAWTGSHRHAAALSLGLKVPLHVIDSNALEALADAKRDAWFIAELRRGLSRNTLRWLGGEIPEAYGCAVQHDDRARLDLIRKAGDSPSYELMAAEIDVRQAARPASQTAGADPKPFA